MALAHNVCMHVEKSVAFWNFYLAVRERHEKGVWEFLDISTCCKLLFELD